MARFDAFTDERTGRRPALQAGRDDPPAQDLLGLVGERLVVYGKAVPDMEDGQIDFGPPLVEVTDAHRAPATPTGPKTSPFGGCAAEPTREKMLWRPAELGAASEGRSGVEQRGSGGGRLLTRGAFLALAGAGIAVAAGLPATARAEVAPKRFSHQGADVEIAGEGGNAEISVDGLGFEVVGSNGAYRAAGFMYAPQPTPEELAKRLVENRRRIAGGI